MKHYKISDLIVNSKILQLILDGRHGLFKNISFTLVLYYFIPIFLLFSSGFDDLLVIDEEGIGMLEDYLFISYAFLVAPLLILFLRLILTRFQNYINSIERITKDNGDSSYLKEIDVSLAIVNTRNKYIRALQILFGFIVFSTNMNAIYKRTNAWNSFGNDWEFYVTAIWVIIILCVVSNIVVFKYLSIIIAQIRITKYLVKESLIEIKPLHPDKAGGLKLLGNLSLSYTYFLAPMVFVIIAHMLTWDKITIGLILGISGYIPLLIFVFFYPLGVVHDAMSTAKLEILNRLSEKFHEINSEFLGREHLEEEYLLKKKQIIELLDNLYAKADRMPNWPFDTITLTKFGSIIGAILSSIWLNWIFGKLVSL